MNNSKRKSRWGFHPCDYPTYLKLKQLHKLYWETVRDFHRWHRWWRKEPQNRSTTEPYFNPLFVEDRIWLKPIIRHGIQHFKVYPRTIIASELVELFKSAKTPSSEHVPEFEQAILDWINKMYDQISMATEEESN